MTRSEKYFSDIVNIPEAKQRAAAADKAAAKHNRKQFNQFKKLMKRNMKAVGL